MLTIGANRLHRECINFSLYVDSHQQLPRFWEFENKSGGWSMASSPDELSSITLLMKNNIDHDKAWNMSIGYVNWLTATLLEQSGNPRVFADDEEEQIQDLSNESEEEINRIAIEQLGEKNGKEWIKARQKAGK